MFWCCRFIVLFALVNIFKTQLHSVSALEHDAKTADNQLHKQDAPTVAEKHWTARLQSLDATETKRLKRETLNHTVSELTIMPTVDTTEEIAKNRFELLLGLIKDLKESVLSNKESINELKRQIAINSKLGEVNANEKTRLTPLKIQSTKPNLLNYLSRISNSKTISGIYVNNVNESSHEGVQTIQKIAGVSPGIITTKMPSYTSNETEWTSFVQEVISNWNNSHLVQIRWGWPGNPIMKMENFSSFIGKEDVDRRWADLITDGGELNKFWKKELDKISPYLQELQSAGVVPIVDIVPYINHRFYIWTGRPGVNGSAKFYQITRDYLTNQHNLTSLIWTWSLHIDLIAHFEDVWPGSDYVDVAAVVMWGKKELPISVYEKLINLVGDTLLSMEEMTTVPSLELLTAQPRWTWFTADDIFLENADWNSAGNITATFSSPSVINKGNIDFFNHIN